MNNPPRRSARISQLHQQPSSNTSLSSSQSSSAASSSYPSPAGDLASKQDQVNIQFQTQFLAAPQSFNAPLPSPSANDYNPFFSYAHTTQSSIQMPQQSQQSAQQAQQQHGWVGSDNSQQHHATHHNSFSKQSQSSLPVGNNSGQLPPDFLAEAARRAQIACLMRDLGDVSL